MGASDGTDRGLPTAEGGAAADLRRYLAGEPGTDPTVGSSPLLGRLRGLLGPRQRAFAKVVGTRLMAPRSARRLKALAGSGRPLLLNLGSGTYNAPGWVNIDLWGLHSAWGVNPDVIWDLTKPLPLPAGSVRAVFLEHVLEHLTAATALAAVDQAHRLLEPGGVLRISVPDFGRYARSYAADGKGTDADFLAGQRPGRPTPLLALAEVSHHHGHVSLWDDATLVELLRSAGFEQVAPSAFQQTQLSPIPDNPDRRGESLYVEGIKAGAA